MNIIKLGGSIVNPNGKYDNKAIDQFISVVKKSPESFLFVVGGGKLCRKVQSSALPALKNALNNHQVIQRAQDWLGIATTKINCEYVLHRFQQKLGNQVYPEIILDPTHKLPQFSTSAKKYRVFFAGGWKPKCSTDKDMMLLAKTFNATKVFKISDFEIVKRITPWQLAKLSEKQKIIALNNAKDLPRMSWKELNELVGKQWQPGLDTPFDPQAAQLGYQMRKKLKLYIGKKEHFFRIINKQNKPFQGTMVKN